jgi:hypothetical protein
MELTQPIQIAQFRLLECMATGLELLVRIQFPNIRCGIYVTFSLSVPFVQSGAIKTY